MSILRESGLKAAIVLGNRHARNDSSFVMQIHNDLLVEDEVRVLRECQ
jgi:hypothetical protein